MPAASAQLIAPPARGAAERLDVELLLTVVPAPAAAWSTDEPSGPLPLFRQVPLDLQRRRSDNWLAWNVGRVRPDPFAVLFERYWKPISAFCVGIAGSRDDAEEAAAEAMSRAYATLSRREERPDFRPWIHAIARNAALDRLRQQGRGPQLSFDGAELELPSLDGPEEVLGRRERLERVLADLQALSERQRAAITMRELSGLTYEEIAETLATSAERAKSLVAEARQSLSERQAGRSIGCGEYRRAFTAARGRGARGHRLSAHRDTCPDCRAFSRPRLLSGVFFLPILELFSRAGRRIADAAGPALGGAGPVGAAKIAAAASVVALAVPAAQHATDRPPAQRPHAAAAAQSSPERDRAATADAAAASEQAGATGEVADPTPPGAGGRPAPSDGRGAAGGPAPGAAGERPAASDATAGAGGFAETLSGALRRQARELGQRLAATRQGVERLLTRDVPALVGDTTRNLTNPAAGSPGGRSPQRPQSGAPAAPQRGGAPEQAPPAQAPQGAPGISLPGVEIGPGGVRVDVPGLLGGSSGR